VLTVSQDITPAFQVVPEFPRTGRATWGPRDRVEYRPRWTSDHHPWAAIGPSGQPNGIRYSNQEVEEDRSEPEPEPEPRKVLGWFMPAHIRAVTGEGTITLQCERGHAEGLPERRLDGPCFADPHVGAFLRAHAHGAAIRSYRP
jgi:hypothetical protein